LSKVDVSGKKEPTGVLTLNKLLVRIWVKEEDIVVGGKDHFREEN